jgi:hypothetical protein
MPTCLLLRKALDEKDVGSARGAGMEIDGWQIAVGDEAMSYSAKLVWSRAERLRGTLVGLFCWRAADPAGAPAVQRRLMYLDYVLSCCGGSC